MRRPPRLRRIAPPVTDGQRMLIDLGLKDARIAKRLGVTTSTVRRWLAGEVFPGPDDRRALEEHYGIPLDAWDRVPEGGW